MKLLNKDAIICSIKYTVLISIIAGVRFWVWERFYLNYVGNELTGVIVQVLWFTVNELIIIQITASFSYMLIHHKKGFKRFFSFLHFKYFKFNLKVLFTYALFWGVCTFAVNDLRFSHSFSRQGRFIFYLIAAFLLALNALKMIFSYFRAENPSESLSKITKIFFGFLNKNFKSVFTFLIKICPWIAGYIFLIVIFNRTDLEMVIYVMLNSSMYGLGVLFFPYYFLNFQKMAVRFSQLPE